MKTLALVLFVCLLVRLSLTDVDVKASERRIGHIRESKVAHHSVSGGPLCQNVVAYYEGTFKNQQHPNLNYTAQFQVQMSASQSDKRIYVIFDQWNNTLLSNRAFSFDFAYDNKDIVGYLIGSSYSGPFASDPTDFILTLDHDAADLTWDNSIRIMYFSAFNNSFQLENAIGQCTKKQLELTSVWNMDPTLVDYCVCCGDYLPSEQLGCPVNPWAGPVQPTTPSSRPALISCQSIVGYYTGTFKNRAHPNLVYSAQFQLHITSDLAARQYHVTFEGWNETLSRNSDFSLEFWYYDGGEWCDDLTVNNTCSGPFGNNDDYFWSRLFHGNSSTWDNGFNLFDFYPFNRTFTFDAIGKCTDSPPNDSASIYAPDPTLYKGCMCCDSYNPHPSLNCPKSPWA